MGERRNLKKQSLEKLQQDLEQTEHQIEVEERRLNLAEQQMKVAKRKARNHSLIVRGAEVEKCGLCMKVTLKTILPLSGQGLHPSKKIISSRKLLPLL